jgi:hypothetical protein
MTEHIDRKEFARLLLESGNSLRRMGPKPPSRKHYIRPADREPSSTRQTIHFIKWIIGLVLAVHVLPFVLVAIWFIASIILALI